MREITIKGFWSTLKRKLWMVMSIIAVIGVLSGIYGFYLAWESHEDRITENVDNYRYLAKNVEMLSLVISEREEALATNLFLNMDPSAVSRTVLNLEIKPAKPEIPVAGGFLGFYESDGRVVIEGYGLEDAYVAMAKSEDLAVIFGQITGVDNAAEMMDQLISVYRISHNMIGIQVYYSDSETSNKLASLVYDYLDQKGASINPGVQLTQLSIITSVHPYPEILELRGNIVREISRLHTELREQTLLRDSVERSINRTLATPISIFRNIVLYLIIGVAAGSAISIMVIVLQILCDDRIYEIKDFDALYVQFLGETGLSKKGCAGDKELSYIISRINLAISTNGYQSLGFSGHVDIDIAKQIENSLKKDTNLSVEFFGSLLKDPVAVERLSEVDAMVFINKKTNMFFAELKQEIDIVNNYGKKIIGVVSLG